MDITMPGMDGLEALKAILAFDPAARVAMVTAMVSSPL
jgi:two-component system chemotaxis response regulator CheY